MYLCCVLWSSDHCVAAACGYHPPMREEHCQTAICSICRSGYHRQRYHRQHGSLMQLDGLAALLFIHWASWIPPGELYTTAVVVAREATLWSMYGLYGVCTVFMEYVRSLWSMYGLSAVPDCDEGRVVWLEGTK